MIYAIMPIVIVALAVLLIVWQRSFPREEKLVVKILTCLYIAFYVFRLCHYDVFDDIVGLKSDFMSENMVVLTMILRMISPVACLVTAIEPFRSTKTTKNILATFVPFVVIANIILIKQNILALSGEYTFSNIRSICFVIEMVLMGAISLFYLYKFIIDFEKRSKSFNYQNYFGVILGLIIACLPVSFFEVLFGEFGVEASGFNFTHRVVLYISIIIPIIIYFVFRKKSTDTARTMLIYLATACVVTFCYTINVASLNWTNLPLHLCNTGVFLIFIAYIFNVKSVFYFTFFVNVIGALFAMFVPDASDSLFMATNIRFWYNHIYVFFLPILGMVLKVFPRPNLKMMKGAIGIFSVYFVAMVIANAWINTFDSVDYFFLQGIVVSKHVPFLVTIQGTYILTVNIAGILYQTYWLYDIIIYFGYILLLFIIWIFYEWLFKVQDHYTKLAELDRLDVLDLKHLRKELGGDLTKPINPRGKNMIKISHFTKIYAGNSKKAVDDFSLTVKTGQVFGFIGHNGAGKSTLIKSLVGIQSITDGKIEVCGYDITKQPLQAKLNIGYVSDNHAVYERLTGREYINYVADLYLVSKEDRETRLDKYSKMFHLDKDLDREIKGYSHGMKQKLVVIASIIHDPKVWVLDEPLTGLDPVSSHQIKALMRDMADRGHIVFFSSHVIEVLEKLCDRVAIIKQGKLIGEYSSEEIKKKKMSLEDIYLDSADEEVEEELKKTIVTGSEVKAE